MINIIIVVVTVLLILAAFFFDTWLDDKYLGCLPVVFVFGFVFYSGAYLFAPSVVESETPIEPEIKLIIKQNKVDTIYIYK